MSTERKGGNKDTLLQWDIFQDNVDTKRGMLNSIQVIRESLTKRLQVDSYKMNTLFPGGQMARNAFSLTVIIATILHNKPQVPAPDG